jgi:DNA invertase Pin-like site-specific DNA recombinase
MAVKLIPAASYIRMSGRQQDKSPAEQREEITKLAKHEHCEIVEWFSDEAITGDSSTDTRPGLAALLKAAKAKKFKVVLAWHTNRVSREDPMDAIVFYNQLRRAGVGLHTCCEGAIDLEDFPKQLLLFINQKANNDFLIEISAKTLRGRIANAKTGCHNGGPAIYAMDRGLFNTDGKLVRRLEQGEYVRQPGHHIYLLPGTDKEKIKAVQYAFKRYAEADISIRDLARELGAKGFPSPSGKDWTHHHVTRMLRMKAYAGTAQWGVMASGKYHEAQADNIVAANGKHHTPRKKPEQDIITVESAHEGIISLDLFNRVQAKLPKSKSFQSKRKADYPLSGLIFCGHCHQPMHGQTLFAKDRCGDKQYIYHNYVCSTYANDVNSTCGRHPIDADLVLGWLTNKLQEIYLGPGRDALVEEIKKQLQDEPKVKSNDLERLKKRLANLEKEVNRLVKAIRTTDIGELVEELSLVQAERGRVKAELAQAGKLTDPIDFDAEAERIADGLLEIGEKLTDSDPAIVREVLNQFVSKITCKWERYGKTKTKSRLIGGTVELRPQTPFSSPFPRLKKPISEADSVFAAVSQVPSNLRDSRWILYRETASGFRSCVFG